MRCGRSCLFAHRHAGRVQGAVALGRGILINRRPNNLLNTDIVVCRRCLVFAVHVSDAVECCF